MIAEKYQLKLANFDGPLDLLLHLISRAKIEVKDIFVSEITEQYLAYLQQSDMQDLESASEFLEMAATLLYIKSRALLPKIKSEEEEELSEEDRLVQRLNEYKRFKEAAEELRELEESSREFYYKRPEEIIDTRAPVLINASVEALMNAYRVMLAKTKVQRQQENNVVIRADYVSMHDRMRLIMARLAVREAVDFAELFSPQPTRMEVAVTFYALLELIAQGKITVRQSNVFGTIDIYRKQKEQNGQHGK
jgi:segregation and condensation protein A